MTGSEAGRPLGARLLVSWHMSTDTVRVWDEMVDGPEPISEELRQKLAPYVLQFDIAGRGWTRADIGRFKRLTANQKMEVAMNGIQPWEFDEVDAN